MSMRKAAPPSSSIVKAYRVLVESWSNGGLSKVLIVLVCTALTSALTSLVNTRRAFATPLRLTPRPRSSWIRCTSTAFRGRPKTFPSARAFARPGLDPLPNQLPFELGEGCQEMKHQDGVIVSMCRVRRKRSFLLLSLGGGRWRYGKRCWFCGETRIQGGASDALD